VGAGEIIQILLLIVFIFDMKDFADSVSFCRVSMYYNVYYKVYVPEKKGV
jgi:hypothetical protein